MFTNRTDRHLVAALAGLLLATYIGGPSTTPAARATKLTGEDQIVGEARVIDGDTIVVSDVHIRLYGIDAPELDQQCGMHTDSETISIPCGQLSRNILEQMIEGKPVACVRKGNDLYGRVLGVCRTSGAVDMSSMMVIIGAAFAYRDYSTWYVFEEEEAQQRHLGIWNWDMVKPWDYRKNHDGGSAL